MYKTIVLVYEVNTLEATQIAESLFHGKAEPLAKLMNENHRPF